MPATSTPLARPTPAPTAPAPRPVRRPTPRIGWLRRLKSRVARGFGVPLGRVEVRFSVRPRIASDDHVRALQVRHLAFLRESFPALDAFFHRSVEFDPRALTAMVDFAEDAIALHHEPAREAQMRRLLHRLAPAITDEDHRRRLADEVRRSEWRDGMVERALPIAESLSEGPRARLDTDVAAVEAVLGSRTPLLRDGVPQRDRGRTLRWVFEQKPARLRDKRVVHVAPESAFATWLRDDAGVASYTTIDGFHRNVDRREDLTALTLADDSVDVVICHRVLEHVPDDRAAIAEIFRVLAPGGEFSVSVPQSLQREHTTDWVIRDFGLFDHVRQYGRDFVARLEQAGFTVERETALLTKTPDEHLRDETYPMLAYRAVKPAR